MFIYSKTGSFAATVLLVCIAPAILHAQPFPDPSAWNVIHNPSGDRAVPMVIYNQVTGVLSLDTLGLNRIDDTPDYAGSGPILGDDVGANKIDIQATLPITGAAFPEFDNAMFQGMFWSTSFQGDFFIVSGVPIGGRTYLWPGKYDLVQLEPGLSANSFGGASIIHYIDGDTSNARELRAGANGITIVPEATSYFLLYSSLMFAILPMRRSKRTPAP